MVSLVFGGAGDEYDQRDHNGCRANEDSGRSGRLLVVVLLSDAAGTSQVDTNSAALSVMMILL